MKERLEKFIKSEGLTPSRFAEIMAVQPSSISHIIGGRNKPSYDFIEKILLRFPKLNPDWLLLGKGTMYRSSSETGPTLGGAIPTPSATTGNFFFSPSPEEPSDDAPEFDFAAPGSQAAIRISAREPSASSNPEGSRAEHERSATFPASGNSRQTSTSPPPAAATKPVAEAPQNPISQPQGQAAPIQRILEEFDSREIERIVVFLKDKTFIDYRSR